MCILFVYNGATDPESDYSLIVASNRDEYFNRMAQCMAPWYEDANIYGGRDLQPGNEGGTWFAVNVTSKKIGVLLNLPGNKKQDVVSRGKIVSDYVKSLMPAERYVDDLKTFDNKCNGFVLVTLEFGNECPVIQTYSNESKVSQKWNERYLGFSNSLPINPLKKVGYGKQLLNEICTKNKKLHQKNTLIEDLRMLLKNKESQLPDTQLQDKQPIVYKELSSIFVKIPGQYGTRAHTIFILTKNGHGHLIEESMESPINTENPRWIKSEFEFAV